MDTPLNKDLTNVIIARNYKLVKKLGAGAFGEIYLTQHKQTKEEYAIKLEPSDSKHPQVFFEAKLYNYLHSSDQGGEKCQGIPRIFSQGTDGQYNYMIMELLGCSLEDLFTKSNRKFTVKTVLMLAEQMLARVEYCHQRQFLHRDIKPDNFLMGYGKKSSRVYLVDFGLAKRYISKEGHIPYKEGKSLTGTARYASVNTHMGFEQSRRDDLESLGYVLLYFLRGQLPWQNMKAANQKEKYDKIMEKKMQTSAETLCKGFPQEFVQYFNYIKGLKFEEKPDYSLLRGLFKDAMKKQGIEVDYKYDWIKGDLKNTPTLKEEINTSIQQQLNVQTNGRQHTEEKKIISLNSSQKIPTGHVPSNMISTVKRTSTRIAQTSSVEKPNRNNSIKNQNSSRNNLVQTLQQAPNKVPQPKIVTTKDYKKF